MNKCPACGSDRIEEAQLEGMAVRLERSSTLKKVFNVGGLVRCRVCMQCGAPANRSQRLVATEDRVVVGGAGKYEARCRRCFHPDGDVSG